MITYTLLVILMTVPAEGTGKAKAEVIGHGLVEEYCSAKAEAFNDRLYPQEDGSMVVTEAVCIVDQVGE